MADRVIIPEVLEPDEALPRDLITLRRLAYLLDAAVEIPGTRKRIGLDAGLGLIPGVGDIVGAFISSWIVIGAIRHRVPFRVLSRMVLNIALDLGIGTIPVLGDIFDFLFKENLGNVDLLIKNRNRHHPPRSVIHLVLGSALVLLIILLLALATFALLAYVIYMIVGRPLV
ncbi:MAG TPA: DUF4112 domain-containing protein [Thermoanaerobaculia bacterium]